MTHAVALVESWDQAERRLSQRTHQREVERGRLLRVLRETGQLLGRGAVEPGTATATFAKERL